MTRPRRLPPLGLARPLARFLSYNGRFFPPPKAVYFCGGGARNHNESASRPLISFRAPLPLFTVQRLDPGKKSGRSPPFRKRSFSHSFRVHFREEKLLADRKKKGETRRAAGGGGGAAAEVRRSRSTGALKKRSRARAGQKETKLISKALTNYFLQKGVGYLQFLHLHLAPPSPGLAPPI